jgi:hypothetical protein
MAFINDPTSPVPSSARRTPPLSTGFFEPLLLGVGHLPSYRKCIQCPDEDWLQAGVWRCLAEQHSGRAFLQANAVDLPNLPDVVAYFDSLGSRRRLALVSQASDALYDRLARVSKGADPFALHPELDGFWLFAGDGHYHEAAVHDPRVLGAGDLLPKPPPGKTKPMDRKREEPAGTKDAVGHFFALNLRNHLMRHLVVADQEERRKEHDMRALKGLTRGQLRMGAPKGTKVLYAWDRAGIDFLQWHHWKQWAVYFISLQKANMKLDEVAAPRPWDRADPRNRGVVSDELCMTSAGVLVRRVVWIEPVSGEQFVFITSEMTLPPGLIVETYRQRWNIERLFDETKTKLGERKAWASSATAKKAQALLLCMAHNLMVHLEGKLVSEEGVHNGVEAQRREKRMKEKIKVAKKANREVPSMWEQPQQPTQRCVKFIRWLRSWFFLEAPWPAAVAALANSFASG